MARTQLPRFTALIIALLGLLACSGEQPSAPRMDSNTNWLRSCDVDHACPAAFSCVCGQCTQPCTVGSCPGTLVCAEPARWALACAAPEQAYCAAPCGAGSPCTAPAHGCVLGLCVPIATDLAPVEVASSTETARANDAGAPSRADASLPTADAAIIADSTPPADPGDAGEPLLGAAKSGDAGERAIWAPPAMATLGICEGEGPFGDCRGGRLVEGGLAPRIRFFPLDLRDDGLVYSLGVDINSTPIGIGSWQGDPTVLTMQLESPAAELGLEVGTYVGERNASGCMEGPAPPVQGGPSVFELCPL